MGFRTYQSRISGFLEESEEWSFQKMERIPLRDWLHFSFRASNLPSNNSPCLSFTRPIRKDLATWNSDSTCEIRPWIDGEESIVSTPFLPYSQSEDRLNYRGKSLPCWKTGPSTTLSLQGKIYDSDELPRISNEHRHRGGGGKPGRNLRDTKGTKKIKVTSRKEVIGNAILNPWVDRLKRMIEERNSFPALTVVVLAKAVWRVASLPSSARNAMRIEGRGGDVTVFRLSRLAHPIP